MVRYLLLAGCVALGTLGSALRVQAQISDGTSQTAIAAHSSVFIPNNGQWPATVLFYGKSAGMDVWVTARGIEFDVRRTEVTMPRSEAERFAFISDARASKVRRTGQLVRMESAGSPGAISGLRPTGSVRNYFYGSSPKNWATNVPVYEAVQINEMYAGVDAVVQFENGTPRYDFVVKPGANPDNIALKFTGASNVSVSPSGEFITLKTQFGDVQSGRIMAFQETAGGRTVVPCAFIPNTGANGAVQFRVGNYDRTRPLIIDPLIYSTYIGDGGAEKITGMTADKSGNIIVVGSTNSAAYPATTGVYDSTYNGGLDGFVTKFNAQLTQILFSTYIGGGADDQINAVSLDDAQNIYIGGETSSTNGFPTVGGWKASHAGQIDGFLAKLSPDGSQLGYATFIGGGGNDRVITVNSNQVGELAVGGETNSTNFSTGGTSLYQKNRQGGFDGFIARFKPTGASVDFSTYLGGTGDDRISSVSYNPGSSFIYFGGECSEPLAGGVGTTGNTTGTFPIPIPPMGPNPGDPGRKPYDNTFNNGVDGIVGAITVTGGFNDHNNQYLGYIGTNLDDRVIAVAVGQDNSLIITGATKMGQTNKFPLQTGTGKGGFDVFVLRVKAGGRDVLGSTIYGGSADDIGTAITPVIDLLTGAAGDYYLAGVTSSGNLPTNSVAPITSPLQTTLGGKTDMFVARVNSTFNVIYSSFHGGKGDESATAVLATDRADYYFAGTTSSDSLGAVPDSYKKKLAGGTDGYIAKVVVTGSVSLSSPTTGASLCPGGNTNIAWSRTDLDPSNVLKIYYSSDGGATWNYIDSSDKTVYSWKMAANLPAGSAYRVRLLHYSGLKSESGSFTVLGPATVAEQPEGDTLCPGAPFVARAVGGGSGRLTYQWLKNGTAISGARDSILRIAAVTPQDAADYTVDINNICQKVTSKAAKLVVKPATAVTEQPKGAKVDEGAPYTFTVKTAGLKKTYQWLKDGFKLPGATDSAYKIAVAGGSDNGFYRVIVTGECGIDTSQAAQLIVEAKGVEEELAAKLRPQVSATVGSDDITATITPAAQGACEAALTDNDGKVVAKQYFAGMPGIEQRVVFGGASLPSGVYWIAVTQNGFTGVFKFTVVR